MQKWKRKEKCSALALAAISMTTSLRVCVNLQRAEFMLASNISGYDVIVAGDIVLTESALNELNQWLNGGRKEV